MSELEIVDWLEAELRTSRGGDYTPIDVTDPDAIDSLDGVELVVAAEVEFGIQIPNSSLDRRTCRSLAGLAHLIQMRLDRVQRRTA